MVEIDMAGSIQAARVGKEGFIKSYVAGTTFLISK